MKIKKLLTVVLCISLSISSTLAFAGCGSQNASNDSIDSDEQKYVLPDEDSDEGFHENNKNDIAKLNNCRYENLATHFEDGHLTFLGNKYTDMKVYNEKDALESLKYIWTYANLGDVKLDFIREEESMISGCKYYIFAQIFEGEVIGDLVPYPYSYNLLKVIVDSKGNVEGVIADLCYDEIPVIDESELITIEDASEFLEAFILENYCIERAAFFEESALLYWDDPESGTVIPVWAVATDSISNESRCMGGEDTIWLIDAYKKDVVDGKSQILDCMSQTELDFLYNSYENRDAGGFFEKLEAAGEKTYYCHSSGQVTVPIAYNSDEKLYYLCDVENRVAVSNCFDITYNMTENPVVSKHPDDLNSWHFKNRINDETGEEYFYDSEYVISNYAMLLKVVQGYEDKLGFGPDFFDNIPLMLGVYCCGDDYPFSEDDFSDYNSYYGTCYGWNVFATSPAAEQDFCFGSFAHIYSHMIISQLSCNYYANETGAVLEGCSMVIGELLASECGEKPEEDAWTIKSKDYYDGILLGEPENYGISKYLGGNYYVKPSSWVFEYSTDRGGIHKNSGCTSYLAYSLSNYTFFLEEDDRLSTRENLNLWAECMYMFAYNSTYRNFGHYLVLASKIIGLSEDKQKQVQFGVEGLGFGRDTSELNNRKLKETGYSYRYRIEDNMLADCSFYGWLVDDFVLTENIDDYGNWWIFPMGQFDENDSIEYRYPMSSEFELIIALCDKNTGNYYSSLAFPAKRNPAHQKAIEFEVINTEPGTEILFGDRHIYSYTEVKFDGSTQLNFKYDMVIPNLVPDGEIVNSYVAEDAGVFYFATVGENESDPFRITTVFVEDNEGN